MISLTIGLTSDEIRRPIYDCPDFELFDVSVVIKSLSRACKVRPKDTPQDTGLMGVGQCILKNIV